MTQEQFRIKHSSLIEHYQYIEMHLEGICASLCRDGFIKGLQDVEKTNLHGLLVEIAKAERDENFQIFTDEEKARLKELVQQRNYWVHKCYYDIIFDRKTKDVKKRKYADMLNADIRNAEDMEERLFEIKSHLMDRFRTRTQG